MYPGTHARTTPDNAAVIMSGTGEVVTYRQLDERSNRLAQLLRARGLAPGDAIALCMDNNSRFFEVTWAAQRSGLYYTPVNARLTAPEAAFIISDCGARVLIVSSARRDLAEALGEQCPRLELRLFIGDDPPPGWVAYDEAVAAYPPAPIPDEVEGMDMLYSSGTTGQPKGVRRPRLDVPAGTEDKAVFLVRDVIGCDASTVFLSTAPLHHGAPLILSMAQHRLGATVVVMERFDAATALAIIERHRVTHSQWVPTMFVRLLKLDEAERQRFDLSSHRMAVHGAGPCAIAVKAAMIEWWGPILFDYYSGTEGIGTCAITSAEWLAHPGSVGRPVIGELHIVAEDGGECAPGEVGTVYFAGGPTFEYYNDPGKTATASNDRGWTTLGDIGYVDDEGYLYLTDRKAFTIVSGGINIYPQEVENALVLHPLVFDVAVFGVPDDELGEATKAVVQLVEGAPDGPEVQAQLLAYCRQHLASYKCPRTIDFSDALPRDLTGKLYKRALRDRYWQDRASSII
jgi:long-chain acyl-CoA synthetase